MQKGWRIGSLFDIPFYIDPSWFPIAALVTVVDAVSFSQAFGPLLSLIGGAIMALSLFGSVLLHELGHSLVARSQGITVCSITLFLFGGVAKIERESSTPNQAFQVAIAGPAVSLALFAIFSLVSQVLSGASWGYSLVANLALVNCALVIFNMIPGLPLDGGQVLKALVWQVTGDPVKGLRWAATSGQGLGILAIALGLVLVFVTGQIGTIWLALMGGFIWRNAKRYGEMAVLQETLLTITAKDVMARGGFWDVATGTISRALLGRDFPAIAEDATLWEVVNCLETYQTLSVTVVSNSGKVVGQIDRGDVVNALVQKLELPIAAGEVEQAKLEARYPKLLPLPAITKAVIPKL